MNIRVLLSVVLLFSAGCSAIPLPANTVEAGQQPVLIQTVIVTVEVPVVPVQDLVNSPVDGGQSSVMVIPAAGQEQVGVETFNNFTNGDGTEGGTHTTIRGNRTVCVVSADKLFIRASPMQESPAVGYTTVGVTLEVLPDENVGNADWIAVFIPGSSYQMGYVFKQYCMPFERQ